MIWLFLPPISISVSIHAVIELFQGHIGDIITSIASCLVDGIDEIVKLFETKRHLVIGGNDQDLSLPQRGSFVFAWRWRSNKRCVSMVRGKWVMHPFIHSVIHSSFSTYHLDQWNLLDWSHAVLQVDGIPLIFGTYWQQSWLDLQTFHKHNSLLCEKGGFHFQKDFHLLTK